MTLEQIIFYKKVIECVTLKKENKSILKNEFPIFLDGKAGRGKTFLINAICYAIRAMKEIILLCGTTALATLLYEDRRIAHSLFRIPVEENNINIQSSIKLNSTHAELIKVAIIIIWDELPIANKAIKFFIGIGDFRQVASVVKGAGKSSTINASIKTSFLWKYFKIYTLNQLIHNASDPIFAEFIDNISENYEDQDISLNIFKTTTNIEMAISFLYLENIFTNHEMLQKRAFLSPQNNEIVNDHPTATPDYLAQLTYSGIPNHEIHLKIGAICSIM
ncbi:1585_t:CDS:2 [Scutellospora calospora]|uniref:1585_t:CDS:1 n=1 Tax=Scutellospora calospora TaxID=85575 RepID=A0ACA9K503_9GLOM|nr:1585_t:CDS:2 [Scutellospora calospora]